MVFNNCDPATNGERVFYESIRKDIRTIFDIGCRSDSMFTDFEGEVHYFDPVPGSIGHLEKQPNKNTVSWFNSFGLGDENKVSYYYPKYQSFYNRITSTFFDDDANKYLLEIRRADEYIRRNNIESIDFVKIDTEGYELSVLKGFGDTLANVRILQFEYGGTFLDSNTNLIDVIDYLKPFGFQEFYYLTPHGRRRITDFIDHYQYCNIVSIRESR